MPLTITLMSKKYPKPVGPYSPARKIWNTLYCSGQIPLDPETMTVVDWWIIPQTHRTIQNIAWLLEEYDLKLKDVFKTTVLLADINDFAEVNTVYSEYFDESKPARSCFAVKDLPLGVQIEIEVIAEF